LLYFCFIGDSESVLADTPRFAMIRFKPSALRRVAA
jgi:hypothetical protein